MCWWQAALVLLPLAELGSQLVEKVMELNALLTSSYLSAVCYNSSKEGDNVEDEETKSLAPPFFYRPSKENEKSAA